jgi:hypothetical protein
MVRTLTVEVQGRPPTPNSRRSRWVVYRDNAEWEELAWNAAAAAALAAGWPMGTKAVQHGKKGKVQFRGVSTAPIAYAVEYVMAFVVPDERERDWDNAVASGKPITDGLVSAGILAGDSTRYIDSAGRRVLFVHRSHFSKVVIRIVEGEPPGSLGL